MAKAWRLLTPPPQGFAGQMELPPFQANLLYNRGIRRPAEVEPHLAADSRLLNDPMLLPGMERGVARLRGALRSGEKIGVFGDFDTDGITGTAMLVRALHDLGATVVPYLPDRVDEGHGLNDQAIRFLADAGVSLLVTVDCGVSSVGEVGLASSLGIDTIVTDHHSLPPTLPEALALISPRRPDSAYPYPHLTGAGMAFKLVEALYADLAQPRPDHLLELAALGTVADVGPLTGENRYLVKRGLEALNATRSPGIQALVASAGLALGSLDTESLAFGLIPRLNAAGRLGRAGLSLDLLTASSLETATPLAERLERMNAERQALTDRGVEEAQRQVEGELATLGHMPSLVIVESQDWAPGILGLIAGKLAEQYYRPVIALCQGDDISRASARSIPEFDIVDALGSSRDLFLRFGGHPRAAGFVIPTPSLHALRSRLTALADERLVGMELTPSLNIDCEAAPPELTGHNFRFIQALAPFGEGNPAPLFLTRDVQVAEAGQVGRGAQHLRMRLVHSGAVWDAIAFRQGDRVADARHRIDMAYRLALDSWGGVPRLKLTVLDFRPSER